jgi:HTH-type transcriptional regulator / antitoxin HigA
MVKLGWIEKAAGKVEQLRAVFAFFGVSSVDAWKAKYLTPLASFRASKKGNPGAKAAWYRKAELELDALAPGCPRFDAEAFKKALNTIRSLMCDSPPDGLAKASKLCRTAGVLVTVVHEIPGGGVSGAAIWRNKTPGIVLTLRFKTDDQLWFSFFHEAGHVLLHQGRLVLEVGAKDKYEVEADEFAGDCIIPPGEWARFTGAGRFSGPNVEAFAKRLGICPGSVVGRLQHEGRLPLSHLNNLKRKLAWVEA